MQEDNQRPVIKPGIERFTSAGRKKERVDLLFMVLIFVIIGIFALVRVWRKTGRITKVDVVVAVVVVGILFLAFLIQDLVALRPNRNYLYFDAVKLAEAYGLRGFIIGKIHRKSNGDVVFKYQKNRYAGNNNQPVLQDFKIKKDCLPISYAAIGEWIDPMDNKLRMCVCGLDFTEEGVSLQFDSDGSFPQQARRARMAQTGWNELALKG
ncbi:hypothetical protein OZX62_01135 [Bifidobacterium sp. ESL0690]|uniref:hypothetical protein n=1 Tax=Bifidobacterium sp. ESL0690 TaxID=2983214 RepID=UPI0023F95A81|nr:hypothetical protein [Bifidobacterium sp. ESL0690]WEV46932.1 hypothetical protein OZX62_01135 [Bifidobacterium sp. ESL0690]